MLLNVELDILMSFNLIVALGAASSKDAAYRVSALGRLAYSYLMEV